MMKLNLYTVDKHEIKLGDKLKFFKMGHKPFVATIYYGEAMIRENVFNRCLWDYTSANLGDNVIMARKNWVEPNEGEKV